LIAIGLFHAESLKTLGSGVTLSSLMAGCADAIPVMAKAMTIDPIQRNMTSLHGANSKISRPNSKTAGVRWRIADDSLLVEKSLAFALMASI
jgi:hypothetical protein